MATALARTPDTDVPVLTPLTRRIGAASGAAYAVLVLVGNSLYAEGASRDLGFAVEMLGYVALAAFVAYAVTAFGRRAPWAATLALLGGVTVLAVKLGGWAAARAAEQAEVTGPTAAALVAVDDAAWALAWLPQALLLVGLAVAAATTRSLPRPLTWTGLVLAAGCLVAVVVPAQEPIAIPFLLSLLWLVVASTVLLRRELRRDGDWSVEV